MKHCDQWHVLHTVGKSTQLTTASFSLVLQNKGGKQGGLPPNPAYPGQHLIGGFPPPPPPPSAPLPGTSMATITKKPRRASTAGGRAKKPKAEKAPRKTTQQQQQHQINWQNQLAIAQIV